MPLNIEIEAQNKAWLHAEAERRGVFIEEEVGRRLFFPISAEGELMRDDHEFPIVEETEWGSRTHFGIKVIPPESERMNGGQRFVQFLLGVVPFSLFAYVVDRFIGIHLVKIILITLAMAPALLFAVGAMYWWRNRPGQVRAIDDLEIPLVLQVEPQTEARLRAGAEHRGVSVESEIARRLSLLTSTKGAALEDESQSPRGGNDVDEHPAHFGVRDTASETKDSSNQNQFLAQAVLTIILFLLLFYAINENSTNISLKIILFMAALSVSAVLSTVVVIWWRKRTQQK